MTRFISISSVIDDAGVKLLAVIEAIVALITVRAAGHLL
jgi:hypothetical protein